MKGDSSAETINGTASGVSRIVRLAQAVACLLTVAALLWWLAGDRIGVKALAVLNELRAGAITRTDADLAESDQLKQDVETASRRVEDEARSLAKLAARVRSLEKATAEQGCQQQADRVLLSGLQQRLNQLHDGQHLTVNGETWARADLEHEARLILNRYRVREAYVHKLQLHRANLERMLEFWRDVFRKHRGDLHELGFQQELARALLKSNEVTESFDPGDWKRTEQAIANGQGTAHKVTDKFELRKAEQQLVGGLYYGSMTPAAEAIRLDTDVEPSLEGQIQEVLDGYK